VVRSFLGIYLLFNKMNDGLVYVYDGRP